MIATAKQILDQHGDPIKRPAKPRAELAEAFAVAAIQKRHNQRGIAASYDAARDSDEFKNYWSHADSYDADSAHSPEVRAVLVKRSRYEIGNNGFSDGIASTYANDLVGKGPTLRMQTGSEGFNRLVELAWYQWTKEIKFRRKLWCMAHAKHGDGEGIAVVRFNRNLKHKIKLDFCLHETEQMASNWLSYDEPNHIDGVKFDEFGNPEFYEFQRRHPGSNRGMYANFEEPERIPARFVFNWFRLKRPGQHRGVPEMSSTLNLGASGRRWRESVLAASENIADHSLFIKTAFEPDEMDSVTPMSTFDVQKRMMVGLPAGYDAFQPKAEQPTATYSEFNKSLVNEQARPKSMPLNKAMTDSSSYNYASGRLDHSTYYGSLDVDREDCNDIVLDPLFDVWFEYAIVAYGWLGGDPSVVSEAAKAHAWDWPKHQVADIQSEASANDKRLKNGTTSLPAIYSDAGQDYEDELLAQATANGVSIDQQRQINLLINIPQHAIQAVCGIMGITISAPTPEPTAGGDDGQTQD